MIKRSGRAVARRTQVERSEDMQKRLAKAAFEVIRDKGHSAFRTALVAAYAGVSQGAQVHHFATKDGLVLAALEHAFAQAEARSMERAARVRTPAEALAALVDDFKLFFLGDEFWVGLDITLAASKTKALSHSVIAVVTEHRAPVYERWAQVLSDVGWTRREAEEIVTMTAALLAGLSMRGLWTDISPLLKPTMQRWIAMARKQWPRA